MKMKTGILVQTNEMKENLCRELINWARVLHFVICGPRSLRFFFIFMLSALSPLSSRCNNVVLNEFKHCFIDTMNDVSKETQITRNNFI